MGRCPRMRVMLIAGCGLRVSGAFSLLSQPGSKSGLQLSEKSLRFPTRAPGLETTRSLVYAAAAKSEPPFRPFTGEPEDGAGPAHLAGTVVQPALRSSGSQGLQTAELCEKASLSFATHRGRSTKDSTLRVRDVLPVSPSGPRPAKYRSGIAPDRHLPCHAKYWQQGLGPVARSRPEDSLGGRFASLARLVVTMSSHIFLNLGNTATTSVVNVGNDVARYRFPR